MWINVTETVENLPLPMNLKVAGVHMGLCVIGAKSKVSKAGKAGELTHDETTIIAGALELSEKTAKTASDATTPISDTFSIDINAKSDRELMNTILEKGHSRIPVYFEQPTNIIGLILQDCS
ncbi:hypothetical protein L2E82_06611 [Cichorium intybus]|uniref:Uncharacterized protein n=1 Tax=Cichorium intybus TaxID=13427 RepID=A0ACB9HBM8_CICIN|nr:hypothetical protein L2E82_06611 [Cichorium intybus]